MSQPLAILKFELLSFWRCGSGRGRSAMLDSTCVRDEDGLPCIPGKTVKGLLRDAVRCLEEIGVDGFTDATQLLFGQIGFEEVSTDNEPIPRRETDPGLLGIHSALLDPVDRPFFAADRAARSHLFKTVAATAVERQSGTAREASLRKEEVVVPLILTARIDFMNSQESAMSVWAGELLAEATSILSALGSKRNRGLGRCVCSLERLA